MGISVVAAGVPREDGKMMGGRQVVIRASVMPPQRITL
jgi:hypothetical protein